MRQIISIIENPKASFSGLMNAVVKVRKTVSVHRQA